jgi:hypothetical protein
MSDTMRGLTSMLPIAMATWQIPRNIPITNGYNVHNGACIDGQQKRKFIVAVIE